MTTEAPSAEAAVESDGSLQPAAPAENRGQDVPRNTPNADPQHRRRRRRRRRHPRIDPTTAALGEGAGAAHQTPTQQMRVEGSATTTTELPAPTQPPTGHSPRKRRRRHRGPRPGSPGPVAATSDPKSGVSGDVVPGSTAMEPNEPRPGHRPHRDVRHRASREERFDREDRGKRSDDLRIGEKRSARIRDPRKKRDGRRPDGRFRERDRNDSRKNLEPKVYQLEAIVDHGFEDVPDSTTEGATRRVDWTILKRTTTDQRTTRMLSTIYVVRRDGIDAEFPHLSAARAAVNKSINHPEKLTLSKADHAAARGAKK
jgi:hypothetical protein